MKTLFDEFFENFFYFNDFRDEIEDTGNAIELRIPVPGFKKEEIEISLEKEILTISGKPEKVSSFKKSFFKSYKLPQNVDYEKIQATQEDGVLKIVIPRSESILQKKMIAIS